MRGISSPLLLQEGTLLVSKALQELVSSDGSLLLAGEGLMDMILANLHDDHHCC